jgi:FAD/FMN-containing dehydrogenase/Fe-S oxidoreductase
VRGSVRDDPYARTLYATDASIFEIEPLVVVHPRDEADVVACVKFAAARRVPVIARGAGSGLAGETLGRAIILDLSVHMNRVLELDESNRCVWVEPGVVLDNLNRALKPKGLRFGPDPASSNRCTLGGMIANNSCGAHSLQFGATRENLLAARVVLADGGVTEFRPMELGGAEHQRARAEPGFAGRIHGELPELLGAFDGPLKPRNVRSERNRAGYLLDGVAESGLFQPQRLLCASEGTLAIVTRAQLKLVPLPGEAVVVMIGFQDVVEAARAVPAIRETHPVGCELLDALTMRLGREAAPEKGRVLPSEAGAVLAVEYEAEGPSELRAKVEQLRARLRQGVTHRSFGTLDEPADQAALWDLRKAAVPLLFRRDDGLQPVCFIEDAAVPVDRLADYLARTGQVFEKYGLEWSAYAHAGHGEPHVRPMMDLRRKEHIELLEKIAQECHEVVWACEGTISGEHGEGLLRGQWVERQSGTELFGLFRRVKRLFDPENILNPGKKGSYEHHAFTEDLRFGQGFQFDEGRAGSAGRHGPAVLLWKPGELAGEACKCNGCGVCRSQGSDVWMCPRFRHHGFEDAAPRAKANVVRRLLTGRQDAGQFSDAELLEAMSFCFDCRQCANDCPSGVNIPKLVIEAKARYHRAHGLPLDKWFFVHIEPFLRLACPFAPVANFVNGLPPSRWLMEKLVGLDRRRTLPPLKPLRSAPNGTPPAPPLYKGGETAGRPQVVLYLDLYARFHAPETAGAAVALLEHYGFEVLIPDAPWTNMPAIVHGAAEAARAQIRRVAGALAPYAERGLPILVLEPTATLCLQHEFLYYLDTPRVRAVARQARDVGAFLAEHLAGRKWAEGVKPVELTLGYHAPCHLKDLKVGRPGLELLRALPGVKVSVIEQGCCGMAGSFGMSRKNYDESLAIGSGLFRELAKPEVSLGATECSTCRMQMVHGTGKRTLHPLEVVAAAHGLGPSLSESGDR